MSQMPVPRVYTLQHSNALSGPYGACRDWPLIAVGFLISNLLACRKLCENGNNIDCSIRGCHDLKVVLD